MTRARGRVGGGGARVPGFGRDPEASQYRGVAACACSRHPCECPRDQRSHHGVHRGAIYMDLHADISANDSRCQAEREKEKRKEERGVCVCVCVCGSRWSRTDLPTNYRLPYHQTDVCIAL